MIRVNNKFRILFLCGWPLGSRGTPGTYKLIEQASIFFETLILTPPLQKPVAQFPGLQVVTYSDELVVEEKVDMICRHIFDFGPSIIHIFNHPEWAVLFSEIHRRNSGIQYILDIKTPLLRKGRSRYDIQEKGNAVWGSINCIFTVAEESLLSWIPEFSGKSYVVPLGVDIDSFPNPQPIRTVTQRPMKFIYVGALNESRKIQEMVLAFEMFVSMDDYGQTLDLYGSGGTSSLEEQISVRSSDRFIKYCGLLDQQELFKRMVAYDVGIAWVPCQNFDSSPSLKLLEYMAAGLGVIATGTQAHMKMKDRGYSFHVSADDTENFSKALLNMSQEGSLSHLTIKENLNLLKDLRFEDIFKKWILPVYEELNTIKPKLKLPTILADVRLTIIMLVETLWSSIGGAEKIAVSVANEMGRRGHSVHLAYLNVAHPVYQLEPSVHYLPYADLAVLREKVLTIYPDVFFCFYFNRKIVDYYGVVAGTGIPFAMQECTNPDRLIRRNWDGGDKRSEVAAYERELIGAHAARIRLVMPSYKTSFADYVSSQVRAFSNPCPNIGASKAIVNRNERKRILCVNGFKPNKGLNFLVTAFAILHKDFPDWDLHVVGKLPNIEKAYAKNILDIVDSFSLQSRFFTDPPDLNIYHYYLNADIHVIASESEGCPTVVLEAMSCGVPSVGFADCPGTNELIRDEHNGMLAGGADRVGSLAGVLSRLMSSDSLRGRLGQQAHLDANLYDPTGVHDMWESLFVESAKYKDSDRLLDEQLLINSARALHSRRMIKTVLSESNIP